MFRVDPRSFYHDKNYTNTGPVDKYANQGFSMVAQAKGWGVGDSPGITQISFQKGAELRAQGKTENGLYTMKPSYDEYGNPAMVRTLAIM